MKNTLLPLTLLISSAIFAGCYNADKKNIPNDTIVFKQFPKKISLEFNNAFPFKDGFVRQISLNKNFLFLINLKESSNYICTKYDLTSKKLLQSFIQRGTKKTEFIAPLSAGLLNDSTMWLHDVALAKIVLVDIPKNSNIIDTISYKYYKLNNLFFSTQLINDSTAIGAGAHHTEYKIQTINLKNKSETDGFGKFKNIPNDFPYNAWKHAHEGFLFLKPTADKAVLAYKLFSEFELLDLTTNTSKTIKGPSEIALKVKPITVQGKSYISTDNSTKRAYINGYCTNKFIYLLYTDKYEMQPKSDQGNKIYVFDWSGKPVAQLNFNNNISSFAVTENDEDIYAFDPDTEFVLTTKINL
ncbi:MAG: BF3164 family lipoprotein [Limnohabitans sp.]|nr:BF3164 family lipoprotein [Limnohabitans sp.]